MKDLCWNTCGTWCNESSTSSAGTSCSCDARDCTIWKGLDLSACNITKLSASMTPHQRSYNMRLCETCDTFYLWRSLSWQRDSQADNKCITGMNQHIV